MDKVIDEKIQSLIDFETINEGSLTPGLLGNNGIIPDIDPSLQQLWEFRYTIEYDFMRYSVIGNIIFCGGRCMNFSCWHWLVLPGD